MSEDPGLDLAQPWPNRDEALRLLPDALQPPRLAQWAVVLRNDGIDETSVTMMDVDRSDNEVCIQRQHWLFDEDTRTWCLDENDEWWMSPTAATQLSMLLGLRR